MSERKKEIPNKEEFVEFYNNNTMAEIVRKFGSNPEVIRRWAKELNLKSKNRKLDTIPSAEEVKDFLLFHKREETAKHFGFSTAFLNNLIKKYGLVGLEKAIKLGTTKRMPLPQDRNEFAEFYVNNKVKDTVKKFQVSKTIIDRWAEELGIKKEKYAWHKQPRIPIPSKEEILKTLSGRTESAASNVFNVSDETFQKWMDLHGIQGKRFEATEMLKATLTDRQMEILTGSMLGDGCLKHPRKDHYNCNFVETHCSAQKDYLEWKRNELKPFSCEMKERSTPGISVDPATRKVFVDPGKPMNESVYFQTLTHSVFTELEKKWYKRDGDGNHIICEKGWRIKIVPKDLELTPLALTCWFLDDGFVNINHNDFRAGFSTNSFTVHECEFLQDQLKSKFKLESTIRYDRKKEKKQPQIFLRLPSIAPFMEIIGPLIPCESMSYKYVDPVIVEQMRIKSANLPRGVSMTRDGKYFGTFELVLGENRKRKLLNLGVFDDVESAVQANLEAREKYGFRKDFKNFLPHQQENRRKEMEGFC